MFLVEKLPKLNRTVCSSVVCSGTSGKHVNNAPSVVCSGTSGKHVKNAPSVVFVFLLFEFYTVFCKCKSYIEKIVL